MLHGRYDKIDLPKVVPVVTRVEHCRAMPVLPRHHARAAARGAEARHAVNLNVVALAMYLRFVHAVSYRRLSRLLIELFGLSISEGALDAAFRRGKPQFDADVANILTRLRRARVSSARMKPPCVSTAAPAGIGCSRTPRW